MGNAKFILGAGITGLVCSYYNYRYMILAKDSGQEYFWGPRIIKSTIYVNNFISRLNREPLFSPDEIPTIIKAKPYIVGYYYGKSLKLQVSDKMMESYLRKTRGENWKNFSSSGMNSGKNHVIGYDMEEVYRMLKKIVGRRIVGFDIQKIDINNRTITGIPSDYHEKITMDYDYIINTISLPTFKDMIFDRKEKTIKNYIYFYKVVSERFEEFMSFKGRSSSERIDFVYFPEDSIPFYRITRMKNDREYCIESLIPINPEEHLDCYLKQMIKVPNLKIKDQDSIVPNLWIKYVGRYANWNNNLRIHDIINEFESYNKGVI